MKKIKAIIASFLTFAMIISMTTACDGGAGGSETAGTTPPDETIEEQSWEQNSGVLSAIENVSVEKADVNFDTKIKWLAWWKMDETTPAVELLKSLYGTPAKNPDGYTAKADTDAFVNINTSYAARYETLAKLISAGDSPDIFPFEINNFPYSVFRKMFKSVDDYFDFTADQWADTKSVMDQFVWGGKNYCPITELNIADLLWYRQSVVDDAGLDDPWKLFENNEWDWDAFMTMCRKFTETGDDKYALDGYNPENALVCTSGYPLIGLKDGKLVSNLNNASIEKCMDMLTKFSSESLRFPLENTSWTPDKAAWASGNTLFFEDGTWRFEEHWYKFRDKNKWDDDEICFVPFPRMTGSDTYYQMMKQDAYMLCEGSTNIDGYKAWITSVLATAKDESVKAASDAQIQEKFGWTDTQLEHLAVLKDPKTFTAVFDFKNGIGTDLGDTGSAQSVIEALTKAPYQTAESYTVIRGQNMGQIDSRIDELNASVN